MWMIAFDEIFIDKTKYGVIIYPAWSKVVEILNDNYTELLSSIIQKVSEIYQFI